MWVGRAALELWVRLSADPEWVATEFDELDEPMIGRGARQPEVRGRELALIARVELIAVTMTFGYNLLAVGLRHLGAGLQLGHVGTEAHGSAEVCDLSLAVHEIDYRMGCGCIELGRVGANQAQHVACEVNGHHLHAQAQPQTRDVVLAGISGRGDLSLHAAFTESAGYDQAVQIA